MVLGGMVDGRYRWHRELATRTRYTVYSLTTLLPSHPEPKLLNSDPPVNTQPTDFDPPFQSTCAALTGPSLRSYLATQ